MKKRIAAHLSRVIRDHAKYSINVILLGDKKDYYSLIRDWFGVAEANQTLQELLGGGWSAFRFGFLWLASNDNLLLEAVMIVYEYLIF